VQGWAAEVFRGTGVRGRDQKRSLACERMAAAQAGNHNRVNGARRRQILGS
jgi:hypothetical protein